MNEFHELKPGERCPYCGQGKRGKCNRKPGAAQALRSYTSAGLVASSSGEKPLPA